MTPESLTLAVGQTGTVTYTVLPEGASQEVTVTVANPDIVSVTQ